MFVKVSIFTFNSESKSVSFVVNIPISLRILAVSEGIVPLVVSTYGTENFLRDSFHGIASQFRES